MATIDKAKWGQFWKYFNNETQQAQAISLLYDQMPATLLAEDAEWIKTYREKPPEPESEIPPQATDLITEFEGFSSAVYNDGVGVPTIGYGSTHYANGQKVCFGDPPITEPEARKLLMIVEEDYWDILKRTIPYWSQMNDNQKSALLSFGYNLGPHFYGSSGFATITRLLSDKDWPGVPAGFMLYVNPGSSVEAGLRRRRTAEGDLWSTQIT